MVDDSSIQHRITSLIDEEHQLRSALQAGIHHPRTRSTVASGRLEVELDQCWDLLRQRRAKREFGEDPDEAQVRPERTVEGNLG